MPPPLSKRPLCMGDSHRIVDIVRRECDHGRDGFSGVEVGCYCGDTSLALLTAFPKLHLGMVDMWSQVDPGSHYAVSGDSVARLSEREIEGNRYAAAQAVRPFQDRVEIHWCRSVAASVRYVSGCLDFVFLDGDHTFDAVALDIAFWLRTLRPSGVLSGHDYDHPRNAKGLFGVNRAVDAACKAYGWSLGRDGSCWWVRV